MSSRDKEKMYAWFSPTAATVQKRVVTYQTKMGSNVIVSCITDNPHSSGTKFADIVFLGEVVKFVSSVPVGGADISF